MTDLSINVIITVGVGMIIIIPIVIYAIKNGWIDSFSISRDRGGFSMSRRNNDIAFIDAIDLAVTTIDSACRLQCWQYLLANKPEFVEPENRDEFLLPLLEAVCMNHILRSIKATSFKTYWETKVYKVEKYCEFDIDHEKLAEYVKETMRQFATFSKSAADAKLEIYEAYSHQKEVSENAKGVLELKIEKNKAYLELDLNDPV